ncbi:MAG: crossover junction endodeoxyribonuclease RuvC [Verrucomicrobiota bacterium]
MAGAPPDPTVILGVDPSLRGTGFGVIAHHATATQTLDFGTIKVPAKQRQSEALAQIHAELSALIARHRPTVMAVEGVIYAQNFRTAITLGAARGAALLAAAQAGLEIVEYAPKRVKAAATGRGGAQKQQVAFMVRAQLGLTETPAPDAADALAVAMAHAQASHLPAGVTGDAGRL